MEEMTVEKVEIKQDFYSHNKKIAEINSEFNGFTDCSIKAVTPVEIF